MLQAAPGRRTKSSNDSEACARTREQWEQLTACEPRSCAPALTEVRKRDCTRRCHSFSGETVDSAPPEPPSLTLVCMYNGGSSPPTIESHFAVIERLCAL